MNYPTSDLIFNYIRETYGECTKEFTVTKSLVRYIAVSRRKSIGKLL